MAHKPKFLVTSAAGNTGIPTTLQLLDKGFPVRAFVRKNDHRAGLLKAAGAEIFVGNQYALSDMRKAMNGIQRAYHCAPTAANGLHFGTVFAIAASEAKLEHVVTLGQWLSHPDHPSVATRESWLNDAVMKLMPDTTLTVNNVGWFAENYFFVLEPIAQLGVFPMPLGDGDIKKNAPPSNDDIAAVNVGALIDPATHAGKVYRPTGPKLLSPNEIATIMGDALGRTVTYRDLPQSTFLKALKTMESKGFTDFIQTQLCLYAEEYRRGTFSVNAPTDAVRIVGGREPEAFETIARRIVANRPEAVRTVTSRIRAMRNFLSILLASKPDVGALERKRDHVLLHAPKYASDSEDWRAHHDPAVSSVVAVAASSPNVTGLTGNLIR